MTAASREKAGPGLGAGDFWDFSRDLRERARFLRGIRGFPKEIIYGEWETESNRPERGRITTECAEENGGRRESVCLHCDSDLPPFVP